jgi:hypothetical protein
VPRGFAPGAVLQLAAALSLASALCLWLVPTAGATSSAKPKHKSAAASHAAGTEKVDINTASLGELEHLPGIGTVMAQKIMAGRPYKSVADLKDAGVPPNTIKGLSGKVKAGPTPATRTEPASYAAASAPKPAPRAEAGQKRPAEKAEAPKPAQQRTFFGIPIGAKPAPKAEPAAARAGGSQSRSGASRAVEPEPPRAEEAPAKGMVWVNLDTKLYHYEGDRSYGATKHGKFMWEDQAIRDGCRAFKTRPRH